MPYTEESIIKNSPIPPLPSFKYKIKMNDRIIYKISENNKKAFKIIRIMKMIPILFQEKL